ncbi:MAG: FAD-binding oxidoreductase [Pseudomonadaceae bacterium]|nr:FAD-binding oxidoreductase [Pseudomonadaceae bacterium]
MKTFDVIIIGAGIVGSSIALSLTRAGLKTLNVDTLPTAGYGSTSYSSAIIRPFYSHVTACAIAHEARARWLQWSDFLACADPLGLARYHETGGVVLVAEGTEKNYAANLAALDSVGVEHRWLSETDLLHRYPNICLDSFAPPRRIEDDEFGQNNGRRISKGIWIAACGHVNDPQLAAHNLYQAAHTEGGSFRFNTRVADLIQSQGTVRGVKLDNGEKISAPIIINAAGPHSKQINQMAGITDIETQAHRHEVAYLKAPVSGFSQQGFLVDLDTGIYQRGDGTDVLIGSADPLCDPADVANPDNYNTGLTEQWTQQAYRAALRFPDLEIENSARGTVGLYDVSQDWIPIYDRTDLPGYFVAIGTSGNQFKNAPVIGEIMTRVITTTDPERVLLTLPNAQREVDLSFYSRLREPQNTSSVLA